MGGVAVMVAVAVIVPVGVGLGVPVAVGGGIGRAWSSMMLSINVSNPVTGKSLLNLILTLSYHDIFVIKKALLCQIVFTFVI